MTIKDIARIAGVTHSTVSRSLNGSPLVSAETAERIRKIAREQGYSPNSFARKLATKRSHTLGLFFLSRAELDFMENFGTQFLSGITTACYQAGYDLLLFTMPRDTSTSGSYLQHCRERQVEGVIFIGMTSDDPHLAELQQSEIPLSMIDYPLSGRLVSSIGTDSRKGIRQAMDWLSACGHQAIAFVGGPEVSAVAMEREAMYRDWLAENGLANTARVFRGDFSKQSGHERGLDILAQGPLPDAILAANDYMALGVIKALKQRGIQVPADVSVMGYDNAAGSDIADPALSTIGQNTEAIGASAVQFILDTLAGRAPASVIKIEPRLVIRESVRQLSGPQDN